MKAMAASGTGLDRLQLTELPDPQPGAGQVKVKVRYAAVNPADWKVHLGQMAGNFLHGKQPPVVTGYDFSGVIDAVGDGVSGCSTDDVVAGFLPYTRETRRGAYAEWLLASPEMFARVPDGMDLSVAAALGTGGATALQGLRDNGRLASSGSVLVVGAAGGVGSLAVGVARAMGARVTAVCSTGSVEMVRELGAEEVIDRSKEDPLKKAGQYDVIYDAAAAWTFAGSRHLLAPSGTFVTTLPSASMAWGMLLTLFGGQRCAMVVVKNRRADLEQVMAWTQAGMKVPIDSVVPVRELRLALERQLRGGMRGKIVVDVEGGW